MPRRLDYELISNQPELDSFCEAVADAPTLGFDTEFVAEDRYQPDLCLVQVAVGRRLVIIDAHAVEDLTPFWQLVASPRQATIVHAGREEFCFCLRAIGCRPANLFDVQLAAGLVGLEYPAALRTLVERLLGQSLPPGESRTNWRRRPLSRRQLNYAARDVIHLEPLYEALRGELLQLGRTAWMDHEMARWQQQIEKAENHEPWRRVSRISGLTPRSLAIVRELWRWRDAEARRRDRPTRQVLRDDLIIELARRQTADLRRIHAVRGLERRDLRKHHREIAQCIERALALPEEALPVRTVRPTTPQLNLLVQFLSTALHSICRPARVAPAIAGTTQDVRELIAFHLNMVNGPAAEPPLLSQGWRAEVVGQQIQRLLEGRLAIRITDPLADNPLRFESPPE